MGRTGKRKAEPELADKQTDGQNGTSLIRKRRRAGSASNRARCHGKETRKGTAELAAENAAGGPAANSDYGSSSHRDL